MAVIDGEVAKGYIVGGNGLLKIIGMNAQCLYLSIMWFYEYLRAKGTADIHYGHLRHLLNPVGYDILGKPAQLKEFLTGTPGNGKVDEKGRDIGSTGFDYLGTLNFLRQL